MGAFEATESIRIFAILIQSNGNGCLMIHLWCKCNTNVNLWCIFKEWQEKACLIDRCCFLLRHCSFRQCIDVLFISLHFRINRFQVCVCSGLLERRFVAIYDELARPLRSEYKRLLKEHFFFVEAFDWQTKVVNSSKSLSPGWQRVTLTV